MLRRTCVFALALILLVPAFPALASDGYWQIPDLGAWLLSLISLDPHYVGSEKSSGGSSADGQVPETPVDSDPGPTDDAGMFIDPSG